MYRKFQKYTCDMKSIWKIYWQLHTKIFSKNWKGTTIWNAFFIRILLLSTNSGKRCNTTEMYIYFFFCFGYFIYVHEYIHTWVHVYTLTREHNNILIHFLKVSMKKIICIGKYQWSLVFTIGGLPPTESPYTLGSAVSFWNSWNYLTWV